MSRRFFFNSAMRMVWRILARPFEQFFAKRLAHLGPLAVQLLALAAGFVAFHSCFVHPVLESHNGGLSTCHNISGFVFPLDLYFLGGAGRGSLEAATAPLGFVRVEHSLHFRDNVVDLLRGYGAIHARFAIRPIRTEGRGVVPSAPPWDFRIMHRIEAAAGKKDGENIGIRYLLC